MHFKPKLIGVNWGQNPINWVGLFRYPQPVELRALGCKKKPDNPVFRKRQS